MPKKRKNSGRSGAKKSGNTGTVQCSSCGRSVPRDKIKTVTKRVSLVDFKMEKELREAGALIPKTTVQQNYCISCAVHRHILTPRPKDERKDRQPLR
nr:30S ribosomal protein S26e [Candidatus Sigynarchaeota archaeon]